MLPSYFGYVTVFTSGVATYLYIRGMFRGLVKPNKVSWFIWGIAPLIGGTIELLNGAGPRSLPIFVSGVGPLIIFIFSFFIKQAFWEIKKLDIVCFVLSILAMILWLYFDNQVIAVLFAVLSDFCAGVPTAIKAWKHPETENGFSYIIYVFNSVLSCFVARSFAFVSIAFPVLFLSMNTITMIGIYRKKLYF